MKRDLIESSGIEKLIAGFVELGFILGNFI